jgi:phosphoribosylformylglycinamidine synthase
MKAQITVRLKKSVLDPQGKAIQHSLGAMGFTGVASVRQGKVFDVEIDATDRILAEKSLNDMAAKLLANTVIEDFEVKLL